MQPLITLNVHIRKYGEMYSPILKRGSIAFYPDYSYDLKLDDPVYYRKITAAIADVLKKGEATLSYSEPKDGVLYHYGKQLTPEHKNFIHALIQETEQIINFETSQLTLSFEYK